MCGMHAECVRQSREKKGTIRSNLGARARARAITDHPRAIVNLMGFHGCTHSAWLGVDVFSVRVYGVVPLLCALVRSPQRFGCTHKLSTRTCIIYCPRCWCCGFVRSSACTCTRARCVYVSVLVTLVRSLRWCTHAHTESIFIYVAYNVCYRRDRRRRRRMHRRRSSIFE